MRPSGQVVHVVELRHVDPARAREAQEQLGAAARPALRLPPLDDVRDLEDGLLPVTQHGGVDELGDGLGVERGVPAGDDEGVLLGALDRGQRDPGEVERREHVRVAELGREAHAEQVEGPHGPVPVDGELRHPVLTHEALHVGPDRVGALGQGVGPFVEDLVEDHDALVRHADLVGVGVHQRPADGLVAGDVPVLDLAVELAADVLDGLADLRQQRFEPVEERTGRLGGHADLSQKAAPGSRTTGRSSQPNRARRRAAVHRARSWADGGGDGRISAAPAGGRSRPETPPAGASQPGEPDRDLALGRGGRVGAVDEVLLHGTAPVTAQVAAHRAG